MQVITFPDSQERWSGHRCSDNWGFTVYLIRSLKQLSSPAPSFDYPLPTGPPDGICSWRRKAEGGSGGGGSSREGVLPASGPTQFGIPLCSGRPPVLRGHTGWVWEMGARMQGSSQSVKGWLPPILLYSPPPPPLSSPPFFSHRSLVSLVWCSYKGMSKCSLNFLYVLA